MDFRCLNKFGLSFPGIWIEGEDRNWAFGVRHVLSLVEGLFVEAVASYALFRPPTPEDFEKYQEAQRTKYEGCLNGLYSKAFVFALHGIERLLEYLSNENMHPPVGVKRCYDNYNSNFGHLKHIRDSAIHIEDRGRGVTRKQKPIAAHILVIGSFIDNRFTFTGEDGKLYQVAISEETLETARNIIQGVIDCYEWSDMGSPRLRKKV